MAFMNPPSDQITASTTTYSEQDVPKWKLERFCEWLHRGDADDEPDMLVGRAVRAPGA